MLRLGHDRCVGCGCAALMLGMAAGSSVHGNARCCASSCNSYHVALPGQAPLLCRDTGTANSFACSCQQHCTKQQRPARALHTTAPLLLACKSVYPPSCNSSPVSVLSQLPVQLASITQRHLTALLKAASGRLCQTGAAAAGLCCCCCWDCTAAALSGPAHSSRS
jgi:hypothetical protein